MRHAFSVHRPNETQVVHVARRLRKEFADPTTSLAVLVELPRRLHHALVGAAIAGVGNGPGVVERQLLTVVLFEAGLVIVRVEVAWATLHEEKDDALRPWRE